MDMSYAYHPQTDGRTEVTNRFLGNLLRFLVGTSIKTWDSKLPQVEFTHNHAVNNITGFSPFQIIYGVVPCAPLDLSTLPDRQRLHGGAESFMQQLVDIHTQTTANLEASISKYKAAAGSHLCCLVFQEVNLVWAVLTRDRMLAHAYNKLKAKKIGPLKVLEHINDNAYRLELLSGIMTSNHYKKTRRF